MGQDQSSEETAVVATYSTRRDAEMAQDRLEGENIQTYIVADDAGGMHPHLQQTHGVRLVALRTAAAEARRLLEEAGTLPDDDAAQRVESTADHRTVQRGVGLLFLGLGAAMIALGGYGMVIGQIALGLIVGVMGVGLAAAGKMLRRRETNDLTGSASSA